MNDKSLCLELLTDYKKQNKRLFVILIIILIFWFSTIFTFVWYLSLYDFVSETTELITNQGDNNTDGNIRIDGDLKNGEN